MSVFWGDFAFYAGCLLLPTTRYYGLGRLGRRLATRETVLRCTAHAETERLTVHVPRHQWQDQRWHTSEGKLMRRRQFVQVATGAVAGALLPTTASTPAAEADSAPFGDFKVGVQSYCFHRFKLVEALRHIQAMAVKHVELYPGHAPLESSDQEARSLRSLCLDHGVTPLALGVVRFTKDHGKNRQAFDHAQRMGIKVLSADPTTDSFDSLDRLVEEYGVAIAIHPHGPTGGGKLHLWHRAEIILEAVEDHHPLVGTCLDTGHLIRCGLEPHNLYLDPIQQIRVMGSRNYGIHLKDNDNKINRNVIVGRGALDVPGVFKTLHDIKFDGCISIEHEANPDDPVPDIQACIEVIQEVVRTIG